MFPKIQIKMLHKNNIFFVILLTVFVMCAPSCINDSYPDIITSDEETSGLRYFSMRVSTADSDELNAVNDSAPEYINGTDFEHAVDFSGRSENVVIFLDSDLNYRGYSLLEFDRQSAQGVDVNYPAEAAYVGFLRPSDTSEIYHMPEYGIIVLNAYNITDALNNLNQQSATIKDVLMLVDTSSDSHYVGRSGNYFTMTSAAYLAMESGEWKHSIVFKIDKEKVFDTRIQAVISPAATAVVERMSAKFSLTLPGAIGGKGLSFRPDGGRAQVIVCNYIDGQPNYNNRTWNCSVEAWGINKYEPTSYYFRNIVGTSTDISSYPYSYGTDINSTGHPFFNGWNNAANHRSFWAVDPNYGSNGIYPSQYRPAVDNPQVNYYGSKGTPSLGYLSYNNLSTDFRGLDTEEGSVSIYSSENTFSDDSRIGGLWQHDIAASEVIIGAQIHINSVDETKSDYDLYRNRIGVFYPSTTDFATYFISTINNQLASQSTMTYRYYDWSNPDNNNGMVMHTLTINQSDYKLYYRDKPLTAEVMASLSTFTIPATIENGDGKVIPWVNGMYIGRRAKDPNTYEEIGDIQRLPVDIDDFKSLIYDWICPFDHFNQGRMVYSIPIRYKASAEKVSAKTYRPTVGDYGVVRNAWYSFAVDAIDGLGTPVDDLNQPIIPYEASLENSIMLEIKVLDWHEFSTSVTLPGTLK